MILWSYHRRKTSWKKWNRSWVPVQNVVHPREFVFHRNYSLSLVISGIQTESGELLSARAPMHYNDAIMSKMASQITSVSIVCFTISSGADQRKHQSSASLAFVRGIHRWPVNSPHKRPITRKCFHLMTSSCPTCSLVEVRKNPIPKGQWLDKGERISRYWFQKRSPVDMFLSKISHADNLNYNCCFIRRSDSNLDWHETFDENTMQLWPIQIDNAVLSEDIGNALE